MGRGGRPRVNFRIGLNSVSCCKEEDVSRTEASAPVGVALIGSGRMGAYHGATLAQRLPGARLTAVADPAPDAAEKLAAGVGGGSAYTDPGEALAGPGVEAGGGAGAARGPRRTVASAAGP